MARTMEAIAAIKASERLDSMHILEMGNVFPDRISPEDEARIRDAFPDFDVDFDVPIARDSMHPNFPGLLLFAMHVEDYLRNAEFFPGNRVGKPE
jgi:hypothetical protein